MIRKATSPDLDSIKKLTEECAAALQERQIFQWNEQYPSREKLKADIQAGELYVLDHESKMCGIIVLTSQMDEEYNSVDWLTSNAKNLYVHRLAVPPAMWGKGYGQELMDFAERFAKDNSFDSIRLDTFSRNIRNQKFYESRGYERLGHIFFPNQSEFPFFCYEKLLK